MIVHVIASLSTPRQFNQSHHPSLKTCSAGVKGRCGRLCAAYQNYGKAATIPYTALSRVDHVTATLAVALPWFRRTRTCSGTRPP